MNNEQIEGIMSGDFHIMSEIIKTNTEYSKWIKEKSFFKNLSLDLQDALPDVKSFSVTNLKYMKYFYDLYNNSNRLQLVDDSKTRICLQAREGKSITNFEKLPPDIGSDLAREITKDPYNFDFLTLREGYGEKELKD